MGHLMFRIQVEAVACCLACDSGQQIGLRAWVIWHHVVYPGTYLQWAHGSLTPTFPVT